MPNSRKYSDHFGKLPKIQFDANHPMPEQRRGGHKTRARQIIEQHLRENFVVGSWFRTGISQCMIMNVCNKLGYRVKQRMNKSGLMEYKRML